MVEVLYRLLRRGLDFCPRTDPIPIEPRCRRCGVAAAVPLGEGERVGQAVLLCKDCLAESVSQFRCLRCKRAINESLSLRAGTAKPHDLYKHFQKTEEFPLELGTIDPDKIRFCPYCRFPTLVKCPNPDCGLIIPTPLVPLKDGHLVCPNPACLSLVRLCPNCGAPDHDESRCPWPTKVQLLELGQGN